MPWLRTQNAPCQFETRILGAASRVVPDNRVVVGHAGGHAVVVAFATFEARWPKRIIQTVEIGRMADRRSDEFGHLAAGTLVGPDAGSVVELGPGVDHILGVCSSFSVACI